MSNKLLFYLFYIITLLCYLSCWQETDGDGDGIIDEKDKCNEIFGDSLCSGCPCINKIKFFMDNSASMAGFISKSNPTEFTQTITNLIPQLNIMDSDLSINLISKDTTFEYNKDQFIIDISTVPLATSKSSELHRIFGIINKDTSKNTILIYASDCIMSFSDADINKNSEVNKVGLHSTLKPRITTEFQKIITYNTICYNLKSKFYGDYYNYQNKKIKLNGDFRPYYIWLIGHPNTLKYFIQKTQVSSLLKTDSHIFENKKDINIYVYDNINKDISIKGNEIKLNKHQREFLLGISGLSYSEEYQSNFTSLIKTNCKNCKVSMLSRTEKDLFFQQIYSTDQVTSFERDVILKLKSISGNLPQNIEIEMEPGFEDWIHNQDTEDDLLGHNFKTFGLKALLQGVQNAYQPVMKIKLKIIQ